LKKENINYLKMASEDLESSKILYSSKKYSQSIFLLQQSVEKVTKGITGNFENNHRTLEIYKKIAEGKADREIAELKKINVEDEKTFLSFMKAIKLLLSEIDLGELKLKVGKITTSNLLLQHILFPHINPSRYPKGKNSPLRVYTQEHFLIKHYDEIYNRQKECLKECFKFV